MNYFQIWNKQKMHNIIISWVISDHIGPMYTEIPKITIFFIIEF